MPGNTSSDSRWEPTARQSDKRRRLAQGTGLRGKPFRVGQLLRLNWAAAGPPDPPPAATREGPGSPSRDPAALGNPRVNLPARGEVQEAKWPRPARRPTPRFSGAVSWYFTRALTPVVEPEHNAPVIGKWLINVHPHGNQIGLSISIHVCRFQANEMSRRVANVMRCKVHFAVVLKPDDALRVRLLPKVVATDGNDVQIAVAVDVGRNRGAGPREKADGMMFELEIALIFQPLDAVPWTWARRQIVESIPIGEQDIHSSVLVQVDQPDTAAAIVFVGAAPNQVRFEISVAIVFEDVDFLPFLADDADDIHVAVVVDIHGNGVDHSGEALQDVRAELPVAEILHPAGLAVVIAELAHDQVETAVAVEIGGANVGDAGNVIDDRMRRKVLFAIIFQDHHRADLVVRSEKLTHASDQHIEVAIFVDIDGVHMGGGRE